MTKRSRFRGILNAVMQAPRRSADKQGSGYLRRPQRFDVFLSAPMASAGGASAYRRTRNGVLSMIQVLKAEQGLKKVYFAAEDIEEPGDFDPANISLERDLAAIAGSEYFILLALDEFPFSSVFFEAGYALAMSKKSIYFVKDRSCLPFLMRQADSEFWNVRIHDNLRDFEAVEKLMRKKNIIHWGRA